MWSFADLRSQLGEENPTHVDVLQMLKGARNAIIVCCSAM